MPKPPPQPKSNPGIRRAIAVAGGQEQLAALLGVKQPMISYYLYKKCPAEVAKRIEEKTGINRREIRPDLFDG